jgi:hypothetical protein
MLPHSPLARDFRRLTHTRQYPGSRIPRSEDQPTLDGCAVMQALGQYALRIGTANLWLTMVAENMVHERDETRELCGKDRCVEEL